MSGVPAGWPRRPVNARRVGEKSVLGDESVEVFSPSVVEQLVSSDREGAGGKGAVLMVGFGDDRQLAEGPGTIGAMPEGLFSVVLTAQTDQVPLGGWSAQLRAVVVEGDGMVDVTILRRDSASRVAAGPVP